MNTTTYILPSYLISYVFGMTLEDMTDTERVEIELFITVNRLGKCIRVAENTQMSTTNDLNEIEQSCTQFTFIQLNYE